MPLQERGAGSFRCSRLFVPDEQHLVAMLTTISTNSILVLTFVSNRQRYKSSPNLVHRNYVPRIRLISNLTFRAPLSLSFAQADQHARVEPAQGNVFECGQKTGDPLGVPAAASARVFPALE